MEPVIFDILSNVVDFLDDNEFLLITLLSKETYSFRKIKNRKPSPIPILSMPNIDKSSIELVLKFYINELTTYCLKKKTNIFYLSAAQANVIKYLSKLDLPRALRMHSTEKTKETKKICQRKDDVKYFAKYLPNELYDKQTFKLYLLLKDKTLSQIFSLAKN